MKAPLEQIDCGAVRTTLASSAQYKITICEKAGFKWAFIYTGELTLWTRLVIRLAGWKAVRL